MTTGAEGASATGLSEVIVKPREWGPPGGWKPEEDWPRWSGQRRLRERRHQRRRLGEHCCPRPRWGDPPS